MKMINNNDYILILETPNFGRNSRKVGKEKRTFSIKIKSCHL